MIPLDSALIILVIHPHAKERAMLHVCQSKSGCDRTDTTNSNPANPAKGWWFCEYHNNPEWVVIGYDTRPGRNLNLWKCANIYRESAKDVQDSIAADQAVRYPHIIYSVVRSSDLWW